MEEAFCLNPELFLLLLNLKKGMSIMSYEVYVASICCTGSCFFGVFN